MDTGYIHEIRASGRRARDAKAGADGVMAIRCRWSPHARREDHTGVMVHGGRSYGAVKAPTR